MPNTIVKLQRNQSMECCKMIAVLFVVCIHVKFPGELGEAITSLARFAVPMFFCISGYFNYQATAAQLRRRTVHILKLLLVSMALCFLWSGFQEGLASPRAWIEALLPDAASILKLLVLHISPYGISGHLWYLVALLAVYGVLWGYLAFFEGEQIQYRPLYYAGFTLFAIYFAMAVVLPLDGASVPYQSYRNGWFTGLPMFLLGLFLAEHQERLMRNFRLTDGRLLLLALLGVALSLLQWKAGAAAEIPLGVLIQVPALLLWMARHPQLPLRSAWSQWLVARFGSLSTAVYVLHLIVQDAYERYLQWPVEQRLAGKEPWVRPLIVMALSLLAAIVWERVQAACRAKQHTA